ncbi:DNA topoisomerase IB [Candidatus Microgenomates bacterium]|nr:DNA topoisomerase IB [Candidatus Microgenomates bacterium]
MDKLIKKAHQIHLRYVLDSSPGIRRSRVGLPAGADKPAQAGQSFKYFDPNGVTIHNQNTLSRIKGLAIPPAWKDVWISPLEQGHLQATGFDKKGRKQYIYHADWRTLCEEDKFDSLIDFAALLPQLRSRVNNLLRTSTLSKEKVLAAIVWLLEHTFIRVGNDEYARENQSFGLTTLRDRHVSIRGSNIKFEFMGKSGVFHLVKISHPTVARTIKECSELPGYELFKCVDEDGVKHIIDSSDVNNFLQEITGCEISAKDFRTWGGTVLAASNLNSLGYFEDRETEEKNISLVVKEVAKHLRNTPKVCRKYYIHPTVITTYSQKILVPHFQNKSAKKLDFMSKDEYKVLTLLQKYS